MEYTNALMDIRNQIILSHLKYKREFIKDENTLNIIDLKIKDLEVDEQVSLKNQNTEHFDFLEKISNDFEAYSLYKPWNRLTKEQKKKQLIIYLNNLINADNLEDIKKKMLLYNENGILTNRYIKYNSKLAKIIGINMLEYDNEHNTYQFQIKLKKTLSI